MIIGFLDADDAHHAKATVRLTSLVARGDTLAASVVTLAEVLAGARRGHHDLEQVRAFFAASVDVLPAPIAVAERAAELRGAGPKGFTIADALSGGTVLRTGAALRGDAREPPSRRGSRDQPHRAWQSGR